MSVTDICRLRSHSSEVDGSANIPKTKETKMKMKRTVIHGAIASLLTVGALAGCGGGSSEPSQTKLLPQTGCVSTYCYGHTVVSSSSVQFWVKTAPWADVHYTVNGGGQLNVRMSKVNG